MIDKKQTAIFKSNQDFNTNKQKISYDYSWQLSLIL